MDWKIPDLSAVEIAGLSLVIAVPFVFQILKRQYRVLRRWIPLMVIGTAMALILSYLFLQLLFVVIAGTFLTSAMFFGGKAIQKSMSQEDRSPGA